MARALVWAAFGLVVGLVAGWAAGAENLVKNPSFEEDADRNGVPDHWAASGAPDHVQQKLAIDRARDGKRCARLECTKFRAGPSYAHAMLCQMGVPVRQGLSYRLSFWARSENLQADTVAVAISDTSNWSNCGLQDSFVPTSEWTRYEFVFRATRTCTDKTRFQIWFLSTGTLWMDDVELVEIGRDLYQPGQIITPFGRTNLVPNGSFECGTDGWGSAEGDRIAHWGGRMNTLFGTLETSEAYHGRACLKIELNPENQPVSFFDYYELWRTPIRAPLAASHGYVQVEPGRPYTFSVYLKAAKPDTRARLRVQQFHDAYIDKPVRVSDKWQRFSLTFTPRSRWCYVLVGPDLCPSKENPNPPDRATVWVDAVQLEQAEKPSPFATRAPIEFGLATDRIGNVFDFVEPVRVRVTVWRDGDKSRPAQVKLHFTDFLDRELSSDRMVWDVPPGLHAEKTFEFAPDAERRGFLRLHASMASGGQTQTRTLRMAVIPTWRGDDSRFGMNHAYPWPHLLDLCRQAGLVWVRDWSLKWHEVEPEKGRFTFTETDCQIDRPRRHGLQVLGLLPFPSSNWSSSAPASVEGKGPYPQNRARIAYAPRDESEFANYVATTVRHYAGRITWWQVFNEPLFTDYSLPRKHGYDGTTYGRLTKVFAQAAKKANPNAKVLAGIGYIQEGQILEDFDKFFATGALEAIDAVDIHHYPGLRPPEFLEGLLEKLNALMQKYGGRKPIWLTEYGYYADDEPASVPLMHHGFDRPLPSERVAAEYAVRWATIGLANGIDKIFYHAGTCQGINSDNMQGVFYKYDGQPRRIYAAQAVMAQLLSPTTRFVRKLALGDGVKAYLFRDGERLVAVVWATGKGGAPGQAAPPGESVARTDASDAAKRIERNEVGQSVGRIPGAQTEQRDARHAPAVIRLVNDQLQLVDLMGRPQPERQLTPSPTPVYVLGKGLTEEAFAAGLQHP